MLTHAFIHSSSKHLWSTHHMPCTELDAEFIKVNKNVSNFQNLEIALRGKLTTLTRNVFQHFLKLISSKSLSLGLNPLSQYPGAEWNSCQPSPSPRCWVSISQLYTDLGNHLMRTDMAGDMEGGIDSSIHVHGVWTLRWVFVSGSVRGPKEMHHGGETI